MRDILITGGRGQLGTELQRLTLPEGWRVVAIDRDTLDLADADAVTTLVASRRWAAVINAGAYTAVDASETDAVTAWRINALAPAAFAAACRSATVPLVQVSTDYVFDGSGTMPREVDDPTGPLGVYGASKLGGELAVRSGTDRWAIVRTSWVVSAHGNNFVKSMLRLAGERPSLGIVDDQWGAPTSAADLAHALVTIAVRMADDPTAPGGIYHYTNAGEVSWCGVAREIFAQSAARGGPVAAVAPITSAEYVTPARRPSNSRLSHAAIARDYGSRPRSWQSALADILDELIGSPK